MVNVVCQLCELFLPFGKPMLVYAVFTLDIGRENPWAWAQVGGWVHAVWCMLYSAMRAGWCPAFRAPRVVREAVAFARPIRPMRAHVSTHVHFEQPAGHSRRHKAPLTRETSVQNLP
jgi:hypothetical protein